MSRYEILDLQRTYEKSLNNYKLADRVVKVFSIIFIYELQDFHKSMMKMGSVFMLFHAREFLTLKNGKFFTTNPLQTEYINSDLLKISIFRLEQRDDSLEIKVKCR